MTVRVNKSSFNIREKLSELGRKFGLKGSELAAAETVQEARDLVSAGRRNILVNGSMQIAQRGTQVTGSTGTGYKTCDRWRLNISNLGTWTIDQSTDAPPGFAKSLKLTCTTADASPGTSDNIIVQQRIEGHDLQSLAWGTSSAKEFTISFYVKSSKAGNATFTALNTDNGNIMVSFQYTISSANTWEYKTITVPAYTAGAFDDDNARSMQLEWWLNSGSQYTGAGTHQTQWAALSQTERNASNLGIGGAVNDTWQLAGVQMEIGRNATEFEHRSYGEELKLCERYFEYSTAGSGRFYTTRNDGISRGNVSWRTPKRANPTSVTLTHSNPAGWSSAAVLGSDIYGMDFGSSGNYSNFLTYSCDAEL